MIVVSLLTSCESISQLSYQTGLGYSDKKAPEYLESEGVSKELIKKIVRWQDIGKENFEKYSQSYNVNVRALIAFNTHTPTDILKNLAEDSHADVRQSVARNTSINREIAEMLKSDSDHDTVAMLVGNPAVPEDIILELYKGKRKFYLSCYTFNPNCPELIRNDALKSYEYMSQALPDDAIDNVIKKRNMSRTDFEKYSKNNSVYVRILIAQNTYTPSDILSILAKDKNTFVRQGVALNTSIDGEIIDLLKNDAALIVLKALLKNPSVPEDIVSSIWQRKIPEIK